MLHTGEFSMLSFRPALYLLMGTDSSASIQMASKILINSVLNAMLLFNFFPSSCTQLLI